MAVKEFLDFEKPLVELEKKIEEFRKNSLEENIDLAAQIKKLEDRATRLKEKIFSHLTAWQKVEMARHPLRPHISDFIRGLDIQILELCGDRYFQEDPAILAGIGKIGKNSVVIIGHRKGRTTEENIKYNFGMAHPEGYRKALRIMKLGEKFDLPIISFIDTPGAYPGIGAEERGQAEAIAVNLKEMMQLKTPIIVVITGEGGSGGALGIGVGDIIFMLENAIYSVISPEGCASILFRDAEKKEIAAQSLKLTAPDLLQLKIIDEIIPEPLGGIQRDPDFTFKILKTKIEKAICKLKKQPVAQLLENRYSKYRRMGSILES